MIISKLCIIGIAFRCNLFLSLEKCCYSHHGWLVLFWQRCENFCVFWTFQQFFLSFSRDFIYLSSFRSTW